MPFNFSFRSLGSMRDIAKVTDFVHKQDLGYPGYHDWVDRMEAELISGYKGAIIAESDGRFAGNLVYQPHKSLSGIIEVKNLRIHPEVRRRNFARFMVRQLELEVEGAPALIGDVPESQKDVLTSLYACGFSSLATLSLYETGARDVVIVKFLQNNETQPISLQKRILSSLKPQ